MAYGRGVRRDAPAVASPTSLPAVAEGGKGTQTQPRLETMVPRQLALRGYRRPGIPVRRATTPRRDRGLGRVSPGRRDGPSMQSSGDRSVVYRIMGIRAISLAKRQKAYFLQRHQQSKGGNNGSQTQPRRAGNGGNELPTAQWVLRVGPPGLQGYQIPGGRSNPARRRRWAKGTTDRNVSTRSRPRLPAQVSAGYVSQSAPTVAAPSLPPSVADGK